MGWHINLTGSATAVSAAVASDARLTAAQKSAVAAILGDTARAATAADVCRVMGHALDLPGRVTTNLIIERSTALPESSPAPQSPQPAAAAAKPATP
jgi:hypothetical protein